MKLYNTLTQSKITLFPSVFPRDGKTVRIYACGPTVYNYFHIGNARAFTVIDAFRRYLRYSGYNVKLVQNFTDIDDKMIKRAAEESTTVAAVAERYIAEYRVDAVGLGIDEADFHPRATDNIDEIIDIINNLIVKNFAYLSGGDVYYRAAAFPRYGVLSHMPIDELKSGARIDVSGQKDDPLDFTLWKASKPGEPHWSSPWGEGRPGWHIECSAMVRRFLGVERPDDLNPPRGIGATGTIGGSSVGIDIHFGGIDLSFPHHENEIAQSEAASAPISYVSENVYRDNSTGTLLSRREAKEIVERNPFATIWMHNGFINVDSAKMSKSLGNFFTVRDIANIYGYMPIRFFLLASHYRNPINYTEEVIRAAVSSVERIAECVRNLAFYIKSAKSISDRGVPDTLDPTVTAAMSAYRARFMEALDDDFNTADAIAVIFELVRDSNIAIVASKYSRPSAETVLAMLTELCGVLGVLQKDEKSPAAIDTAWIEERIAARAEAKKNRDWMTADSIRAELTEKGITITDTPQGTMWK